MAVSYLALVLSWFVTHLLFVGVSGRLGYVIVTFTGYLKYIFCVSYISINYVQTNTSIRIYKVTKMDIQSLLRNVPLLKRHARVAKKR